MLASWSSRITAFTGFTGGSTIPFATSGCTSRTTSGSVSQPAPRIPAKAHTDVRLTVPTPFASHAFHPLDGYAQSVPYHLFIYLFPLHRKLYLGLFIFVNFWTILIHDSDMITGHPLEKVINGPAHHTLHHIYFTVNYGQVCSACTARLLPAF